MENEEGCTIHLEVRIENDELVDKAILCPSFGGAARTFKACDGDGVLRALGMYAMRKSVGGCATDEEMERNLEEIWREVKAYLLRARKELAGASVRCQLQPRCCFFGTA